MQGIHARSISHRMKKKTRVDANLGLGFPFQGRFQGQNVENVKMT